MKTIYYRVPAHCEESWFPLDVTFSKNAGFEDLIADAAAEDFGNDSENLQGWMGEKPLRFEFSETEGGTLLFSCRIYAVASVSYHVREVKDAND